jgi:hypothetical protein
VVDCSGTATDRDIRKTTTATVPLRGVSEQFGDTGVAYHRFVGGGVFC